MTQSKQNRVAFSAADVGQALNEWVSSGKAQKELKKAAQKSQKCADALAKARVVDPATLNEPITV